MNIAVIGLSHRTAPVEVREKLSISDEHIEESFNSLKANDQVLEVSILSTCNRLEIYALVKNQELGISAIKEFLIMHSGLTKEDLYPHLFSFNQAEAVNHLMRVSGGLDSLVLGEGQILSQVKKWYVLDRNINQLGQYLIVYLPKLLVQGKEFVVRPIWGQEQFLLVRQL